MAKMAGPWIPLPEEVIFLFQNEAATCMKSYVFMLALFPVEEITDTEDIWVAGRIHATRYGVAQRVDKSVGHFNSCTWPRWIEIGLAETRDGGIYLPMLYKKGDSILQPAKIAQEMKELRIWKVQTEKTIQNLLTALAESSEIGQITDKGRNVITTHPASMRPDTGSNEAGSGLIEAGLHPFKVLRDLKITLSDVNKRISGFYRAIGQNRISGPVRDKANASFKKLLEEGYKPGEIAFALEWIPENATEQIKHFGIVAHMIDQAIEAGKAEMEKEEARKAQEEEKQQEKTDRDRELAERETLKEYKAKLTEVERLELRNKALEKLHNTPGMKSDYIVEPLVEAMENDLIRSSGIMLSEDENNTGIDQTDA